jgi:hypothetical protein
MVALNKRHQNGNMENEEARRRNIVHRSACWRYSSRNGAARIKETLAAIRQTCPQEPQESCATGETRTRRKFDHGCIA